ncbi:MAG: hypothetical protein QGG36_18585 [Pirellulaceae bacterium]|jgi:hypothetical protein|nr:hypothetical protein [Pirellulaceae bacterium]MDP7017819.1 hypothetical protein [Pirellulaceae bacterium]
MRSRLIFRLRTLLIAVSVSCCALGVWWHHLAPFRRQQKALIVLRESGAAVTTRVATGSDWRRRLVGEDWFVEVTSVRLDRQQVTTAQLEAVVSLIGVLELSFIGANFDDRDAQYLRAQPTLIRLYLQGTDITDEGLRLLPELVELRYVDIRGTRVSLRGVQKLEAALPQARVLTDRR